MKWPTVSKYSVSQKAAHWMILALCIVQFPTASAIQRTHAAHPFGVGPSPQDLFLHKVHMWSGWAILLLAMFLLGQRLLRRTPELPDGTPAWQRLLARAGHACLYLGLLALAVTGTGTTYLSRGFGPIHIGLTKVGIALVLLHVAAAFWHQFVLRDGLLSRMMPPSPSSPVTRIRSRRML